MVIAEKSTTTILPSTPKKKKIKEHVGEYFNLSADKSKEIHVIMLLT